jgi:hypothetical protein
MNPIVNTPDFNANQLREMSLVAVQMTISNWNFIALPTT